MQYFLLATISWWHSYKYSVEQHHNKLQAKHEIAHAIVALNNALQFSQLV